MTTLRNLEVALRLDTRQFDSALGGVQRKAGGLKESFGRMFEFAGGAAIAGAFAGISRGLVDIGREALGAIAAFEQLNISMTTLSARELMDAGFADNFNDAMDMSAGRAKELVAWIDELAVLSPFTEAEVATTLRLALNYGFVSDQAQRLTAALIDYTSAMGLSGFQSERMSRALGQIKQRGHLASQEINQLTEAGVDVRRVLTKAMDISAAKLQEMVEDGAIPADLAIELLLEDMEKLKGAAKANAGTFTGLISTLSDIKQFRLRDLFGSLAARAQPNLQKFVDLLQSKKVVDAVKKIGDKIGTWVGGGLDTAVGAAERFFTVFEKSDSIGAGLMAGLAEMSGGAFDYTVNVATGTSKLTWGDVFTFEQTVSLGFTTKKLTWGDVFTFSQTTALGFTTTKFTWSDVFSWEKTEKLGLTTATISWGDVFSFSEQNSIDLKATQLHWGDVFSFGMETRLGFTTTKFNWADVFSFEQTTTLGITTTRLAWADVFSFTQTTELGFTVSKLTLGDIFGAEWVSGTGLTSITIAGFTIEKSLTWEDVFGPDSVIEFSGNTISAINIAGFTIADTLTWEDIFGSDGVISFSGNTINAINIAGFTITDKMTWEDVFASADWGPKFQENVLTGWVWPEITTPLWVLALLTWTPPAYIWPTAWPELPTITWPELPKFDWPSLPSFSWPSLPDWAWPSLPEFKWPTLPSWSWPSIPMPSWVNSLLNWTGLGVGANAAGTNSWDGGWTWVGERGPELLNLPRGSQILSNQKSMAMIGQMADGNTDAPPYTGPYAPAKRWPVKTSPVSNAEAQARAIAAAYVGSADKTSKAFERAAKKAADAFKSALQKIPGLFGTSGVTQEQMDLAAMGVPQNFADDYVRHLSDEILNGVDWAEVDVSDAAARAGIDPSLPQEAILALFKQAWSDSSLFSDPKNLELINKDAVQAGIDRSNASAAGAANIFAMFGITPEGATGQAIALGGTLRTGIGQGLAGTGVGTDSAAGIGTTLTDGIAAGVTPESLAPVGSQIIAGVSTALAQPDQVATLGAGLVTALSTQLTDQGETAFANLGRTLLSTIATQMGKNDEKVDFVGPLAKGINAQLGMADAIKSLMDVGAVIARLVFEGYFKASAEKDWTSGVSVDGGNSGGNSGGGSGSGGSGSGGPNVPGGGPSPRPRNANGTSWWRGGLSWVGERGPELLNIPRGAQILPAHISAALAGMDGMDYDPSPVVLYATINNKMDMYEMARRVAAERRSHRRR